MALKFPESADECVYFTRRDLNNNGKAIALVFKEKCPKCSKGMMGKPRDPKTGKPKIRAKEYTCPECNYTVEKEAYEDTLTANIQYTCSHCSNQGEVQVSFTRKKVRILDEEEMKKKTVDVLRFQCQKCKQNVDITKKMK